MISVQAAQQHKLMDLILFTPEQVDWVNLYHSRSCEILAPFMDDAQMACLK